MTNQEAIEMMKAKLECMTRDVNGFDPYCIAHNCDNCELLYAQGNMGEQKEWLKMGIKALENQKTGHWIRWYEKVEHETYTEGIPHCKCSECNKEYDPHTSLFIKYCSNCGAKMEGENKC